MKGIVPVHSQLSYVSFFMAFKNFPPHFDHDHFLLSPFPPLTEKIAPQLTRRPSTVTLAAHVRRGLIRVGCPLNKVCPNM